MSAETARELLKQEVEQLPDDLAEQVLDFVLFVQERQKETAFLWQQVGETEDYRRQHPEDVITTTAEEWERNTSHLSDEQP